jgi:hypothetical protein
MALPPRVEMELDSSTSPIGKPGWGEYTSPRQDTGVVNTACVRYKSCVAYQSLTSLAPSIHSTLDQDALFFGLIDILWRRGVRLGHPGP